MPCVVRKRFLILLLLACQSVQGNLDFLTPVNDTNITAPESSTTGLDSTVLNSAGGGVDFHDFKDFKPRPYLFPQGSEVVIDLMNEWLLQMVVELIALRGDAVSVPTQGGDDSQPRTGDSPKNSKTNSGSGSGGSQGASGSSDSGEEQPASSQQAGDGRKKDENAASDSVLEGITTPLLQRLLALDHTAFETWQDLLARRSADPDFQFPELAPTFEALEKKLIDLNRSEKTSSDECRVFERALSDISALKQGGFRYREAILLSRKLVYLIDFYYYVRVFRPHIDPASTNSYIYDHYFMISPHSGVYNGEGYPHRPPWNARAIRQLTKITPVGPGDHENPAQENRVYGIRAYPENMDINSLYEANLGEILNTSWSKSPEKLLNNPNAIALPLTDPLTESVFIRLSRFTVFPIAVSTWPVIDADSELMTPATFHEHDYEHLQNILKKIDIEKLKNSFSAINSVISHFERVLTQLPALSKRLAVIIVFHFLHELPYAAYTLSELSEQKLLEVLERDRLGVKWQIASGYYLDLEKINIPSGTYEEAISLILKVFRTAD